MNKFLGIKFPSVKKHFSLAAAAFMLSTGIGAVRVFAYSVNAGGGNCDYGIGKTYVWSYYSDNHCYHSFSVQGRYKVSSGSTAPWYVAKAFAEKVFYGNQSYHNFW